MCACGQLALILQFRLGSDVFGHFFSIFNRQGIFKVHMGSPSSLSSLEKAMLSIHYSRNKRFFFKFCLTFHFNSHLVKFHTSLHFIFHYISHFFPFFICENLPSQCHETSLACLRWGRTSFSLNYSATTKHPFLLTVIHSLQRTFVTLGAIISQINKQKPFVYAHSSLQFAGNSHDTVCNYLINNKNTGSILD